MPEGAADDGDGLLRVHPGQDVVATAVKIQVPDRDPGIVLQGEQVGEIAVGPVVEGRRAGALDGKELAVDGGRTLRHALLKDDGVAAGGRRDGG